MFRRSGQQCETAVPMYEVERGRDLLFLGPVPEEVVPGRVMGSRWPSETKELMLCC